MAVAELGAYNDILIVLGAAGVIIPVMRRIGIGSIPGFLLTGIVIGPGALGGLSSQYPWLSYITIASPQRIAALADLGVVFLLFLIGIELSFERLINLRRLVFGLGGLQVLISACAIGLAAAASGSPPAEAVVIGAALSLSSTAVVIQMLSDQKRLSTSTGRVSFSVLLMQDLAVVPILLLIGILGGGTDFSLNDIALALGQAVLGLAAIFAAGRYLMRPLLRIAAHTRSADLFMAVTLLIAVGAGATASAAGLSMALGAFMAGLLLAETEYRREIEAIVEPFKGLLLGAFFLLTGMSLGIAQIFQYPLMVLGTAVGLVALKAAILYPLARAFRVGPRAAFETALMLGPGGEFAFVMLGLAGAANLVASGAQQTALTAVSLSLAAIPLLSRFARRLGRRLARPEGLTAELSQPPPEGSQPKVIIAGFGGVGKMISALLDEHKVPYIAIEVSPELLNEARKNGVPAFYGDASRPEFLRRCGIAGAKAVVITIGAARPTDDIVQAVKRENPSIKIIARARDDRHAIKLYEAGVSEAVAEAFEFSLQLGEAAMVEAGVPVGLAIASVHEKRDVHRRKLGQPDRRAELKRLRSRAKIEP